MTREEKIELMLSREADLTRSIGWGHTIEYGGTEHRVIIENERGVVAIFIEPGGRPVDPEETTERLIDSSVREIHRRREDKARR